MERLQCNQLSTGNLLRRHIQEGTDLGKSIDLALKSGKLVSDDHVIAMVSTGSTTIRVTVGGYFGRFSAYTCASKSS